jgi:hypothetical protein
LLAELSVLLLELLVVVVGLRLSWLLVQVIEPGVQGGQVGCYLADFVV